MGLSQGDVKMVGSWGLEYVSQNQEVRAVDLPCKASADGAKERSEKSLRRESLVSRLARV